MDGQRNQTNENVLLNVSNQCKYFSLFSKVTTLVPPLCSIFFQPCFFFNFFFFFFFPNIIFAFVLRNKRSDCNALIYNSF